MDERPQYLYKYRSMHNDEVCSYLRSTIVDSNVYFAKPSEFNDPFDCAPKISVSCPQKELRDFCRRKINRLYPQESRASRMKRVAEYIRSINSSQTMQRSARKALDFGRERFGVFSLSEVSDSILMWSHYADSHKGVCLKFKAFDAAARVVYQVERPAIRIGLKKDDRGLEYGNQMLLHKYEGWNYEKEWRVILRPGGISPYKDELCGVIFGAQISEDNKRKITSWVTESGKNIEFFQAKLNEDQFRLDITPLAPQAVKS